VRGYDLARLTGRRVENLRGRAVAVDPDRGAIAVECGGRISEIPFDQVVIAVDSSIDLDAVPGVAEHAHSLAGPVATIRLREALRALAAGSPVAVCGAGFTGIEMASELAGARPDLRVALVSAGRIGEGLSELGGAELRRRLERLGVDCSRSTRPSARSATPT
jgi:NADH:ubiquinone reductase (H+-translocating)